MEVWNNWNRRHFNVIFDITWTSGDAPDLNKSFFEENELSVTPCSLKNNSYPITFFL